MGVIVLHVLIGGNFDLELILGGSTCSEEILWLECDIFVNLFI